MTTQIVNAQIESVSLGYQSHGILTMYLHLKWSGAGCGFGGYTLDEYNKATKERVGTAWGLEFVTSCMKTVGVEDFNQLKGKYVRAETEGLGGGIVRIGHITEDRWFNPKEDLKWLLGEQND